MVKVKNINNINDGQQMDHLEASMLKVNDDGYLLQQRWLK